MEDAQVAALLVRRCVAGDASAWEEIVQLYHRRIYNICYRFAGSAEDAQDLTQEVFIKVHRTLATYDLQKGAFIPRRGCPVSSRRGFVRLSAPIA